MIGFNKEKTPCVLQYQHIAIWIWHIAIYCNPIFAVTPYNYRSLASQLTNLLKQVFVPSEIWFTAVPQDTFTKYRNNHIPSLTSLYTARISTDLMSL